MNTIATDDRQILGEFRMQDDAIPLKIGGRHRDDLPGGLVQVQWLERELPLGEQRAQPRNHIRGTVAIADRAARGFARTLDVRGSRIQHPKARTGIGNDAREGLIDLMGDRRRQRAQGRHA